MSERASSDPPSPSDSVDRFDFPSVSESESEAVMSPAEGDSNFDGTAISEFEGLTDSELLHVDIKLFYLLMFV